MDKPIVLQLLFDAGDLWLPEKAKLGEVSSPLQGVPLNSSRWVEVEMVNVLWEKIPHKFAKASRC